MFLVYFIVHPLLLKGNSNFETKGLFTKREEDPRRRKNFSFALHAEISVGVVTKWRRKRGKIDGS